MVKELPHDPITFVAMKCPSLLSIVVMLLATAISCQQRADVMRISSWVSSPAETEMFETTLEDFRQANPSVEFNFEPIPGTGFKKAHFDTTSM